MQYVIGKPEFISNLDGWVGKNEQRYADYIARNKIGIPPMFTTCTSPLYRGMVVDAEFMNKLNNGGIVLKTHTSWSKDQKRAKAFVNDPKFRVATKNGISILIKKVIPAASIVMDIHGFVLFMGEDQLSMLGMDELSVDSALTEQEVLIKKGVKITTKDITVI